MAKVDFWSTEHADILRAFLRIVISPANGLSEETVCNSLRQNGADTTCVPSARALRNFLDQGHSTRNQERLTVLLRWGVSHVEKNARALLGHAEFKAARGLLDRLDEQHRFPRKAPLPSPKTIEQAIHLVGEQFSIKEHNFKQLQKDLFREEHFRPDRNRSERYFLCYRYHSVAGEVVKSFLALMGPNDNVPGICRFACFFEGSTGTNRRANGIVLPMRNATYLVGEVDEGAGLKIMAMRDLSTARKRYEGLILSLDDDLSSVASRIVLVPTEVTTSGRAGVGIKAEDGMEKELSSLRLLMQNRIDFTLDEELLFDGKPIDQQTMVVKMAELLRDADTGRSRLTDRRGNEFNPAASRHYTFNAALTMWSTRNKP